MLSDRLRLLEERGFIYRHYEPSIPPAVTYGITDRMQDINKVLAELDKLGRKWGQEDSEHNAGRTSVELQEKPARANHSARSV
jgi:DNA-binding HxlR family transcriptional regulator